MFEEVRDDMVLRESMLRYLYRQYQGSDYNTTSGNMDEATATMSSALATQLFHGYGVQTGTWGRPYYNSTVSVKMPLPVVTVRCFEIRGNASKDIEYFSESGKSLQILENLGSWVRQKGHRGVQNWNGPDRIFDPVWLAAPEQGSHSLLGVFLSSFSAANATVYQILDDAAGPDAYIKAACCSISAYWINAESISIVDGTKSTGHAGYVQTGKIDALKLSELEKITLNVTGLDMLWDSRFSSIVGQFGYTAGLAGAFALGLSQVPTNVLKLESYATRTALKLAKNNFNVTTKYTKYGYGYSEDSTAIRLSLAVISGYCLVTVAYIVYVLITGHASTAWNSAVEVVALALQSKTPDYPNQGHTAAGIDSLATLRQNVGIRVNTNNELELVFANDRNIDRAELKMIERDRA